MFFLVFHGEESDYVKSHKIHESPKVVTIPLILLAIPSVVLGLFMIQPILSGSYFADAISVLPQHDVLASVYAAHYDSLVGFVLHGFMSVPVWLAISGVALAWFFYMKRPDIPAWIASKCTRANYVLSNAYGFDRLNEIVFVKGSIKLGQFFWKSIDMRIIDTGLVNGTVSRIGSMAAMFRESQTGYLYHYAFVMLFGLLGLLIWALW
jgi:NADH-quinone oxidoreductase subunit L